MMAFIEQEANEKAEEIDAKVIYDDLCETCLMYLKCWFLRHRLSPGLT